MNARTLRALFGALAFSSLAAGCDDLAELNLNDQTGDGTDPTGPTLERTDLGAALPIDHPPVDTGNQGDGKVSAEARRVTVFQLERSIQTVLGNDVTGKPVNWMVGTTSGFSRYGATLGQADYLTITEDNLEPSALYLKFVGDAARDACDRALDADVTKADGASRVIERFVSRTDTVTTNPDGVDENLRYLKLRFHGVKLADGDVTRIAPLRKLFDAVVTKAKGTATTATQAHVQTGWHAVCVALISDPEFHIY